MKVTETLRCPRFKAGRRLLALPGLCLMQAAATAVLAAAAPGEAQAPATRAEERIEEIEVIGQRSMLQLRSELRAIENKAFALFNDLNSDDDFDVHCSRETPTGTRISHWECVPRYLVNAEAQNAQDFLQFGIPMKDQEQLWWENRHKHEQLNAEMKALAAENPELLDTLLDLKARQERLAELEREQRSESRLGRFFGRSRAAAQEQETDD